MAKTKKQFKSQSFEDASRAHWLDVGLMLCLIVSLTFSLVNLVQNNLQQSVWESAPIRALGNQAVSNALIINGSLQEDKLLTSSAYPPSLMPTVSKKSSKYGQKETFSKQQANRLEENTSLNSLSEF